MSQRAVGIVPENLHSISASKSVPRPTSRSASTPASPAAPFIKWVGGKGRLLAQFEPLLPSAVEKRRHVEPFIGGGALFFHRQPRAALLSDVNAHLITTYRAIRDDVDAVIRRLARLKKAHTAETYYANRERYNNARSMADAERAALFIYLNKTCFNGLHRVNQKGHFNVPIGRYTNPRILDEEGLRRASAALQGAELVQQSFEQILRQARPSDFVYFDPPYAPLSETANFTSYAEGGFGLAEQERLRDVFAELDRKRCKVMLSNSDTPLIHELYKGYRIDRVAAPRAINCNAKKRGPITEVVVRNYE